MEKIREALRQRQINPTNCIINPKCPEAIVLEPYDWCKLNDKVCVMNTGNTDFDTKCKYYLEYLEEIENETN